jgi:DNA-binding CsgD family transcriptional regulator
MGTSDGSRRPRHGRGPDLTLLLRLVQRAQTGPAPAIARQRRLIADLFRLIATHLGCEGQSAGPRQGTPAANPSLSTRMSETLQCLLAGDSEKQIASRLRLSQHTVHVYVKALYRRHSVSSRGELLANFIPHQTLGSPSTRQSDPQTAGNGGPAPRNGHSRGDGSGNGNGCHWGDENGRGAGNPMSRQSLSDPPLRAQRPARSKRSPGGNSHEERAG